MSVLDEMAAANRMTAHAVLLARIGIAQARDCLMTEGEQDARQAALIECLENE